MGLGGVVTRLAAGVGVGRTNMVVGGGVTTGGGVIMGGDTMGATTGTGEATSTSVATAGEGRVSLRTVTEGFSKMGVV